MQTLSGRALKQGVQAVSDYAIDHEGGACLGDFAEEKLTAAVSVDVDCVDQFKPRNCVQVLGVGYIRQRFVEVAVHVLASHYGDHVLQVGIGGLLLVRGLRHASFRRQDEFSLVDVSQIKNTKLHVFKDGLHGCGFGALRRSCELTARLCRSVDAG